MKKPNSDPVAKRIAGWITSTQAGAANYLNRKTAYWNRASKLIALFLFCLLFGGACLYFIIKAFF